LRRLRVSRLGEKIKIEADGACLVFSEGRPVG
jgi:hypothetical protein